MPKSVNVTQFGIADISKDINGYYLNNMQDVLDILQRALNDFS